MTSVHAFDNQNILHTEPIEFIKQYMETTVGRVILNDSLPQEMPFINGLLKKKGLSQLVQYCYLKFGLQITVQMLDEIKSLGFLYATRAGISIGIDDMVVPGEKAGLVREAEKEVVAVESQYQDGAITHGERYNKKIIGNLVEGHAGKSLRTRCSRPWRRTTLHRYPLPEPDLHHGGLRRARIETADPPAFRQARPDGQAVGGDHRDAHHGQFPRRPERFAVLYFNARRAQGLGGYGVEDAPIPGYLTRRLVDVAQDVIVTEND